MNAAIVLVGAGLATWVLRIGFIGLIPARMLPVRIRRALDVTGPSAMAALIVNDLIHEASRGAAVISGALIATAVAALVMWRFQNLALVTVAGIGTYWAASLVV
jgi:branched-subunit amino acid transport protein